MVEGANGNESRTNSCCLAQPFKTQGVIVLSLKGVVLEVLNNCRQHSDYQG